MRPTPKQFSKLGSCSKFLLIQSFILMNYTYYLNLLRRIKHFCLKPSISTEDIEREVDLQVLPILIDIINSKKRDYAVVDVGANLGLYSYYFLNLIPSSSRLYAFEPRTDIFKILRNKFDNPNFRCEKFAISDRIGTEKLYLNASHGKNSFIYTNEFSGFSFEYSCTIDLDTFFRNKNLNVSFLKIDAEGSEYRILKGCKDLLTNHQPIILCEIENRHLISQNLDALIIINYILDFGYKCFVYDGNDKKFKSLAEVRIPKSKSDNPYYFNFWFLHSKFLSDYQEPLKIIL